MLVFNEELEELRDFLIDIKSGLDDNSKDTDVIIRIVVKYLDKIHVPDLIDEYNRYIIGRVRRTYIINILDCVRDLVIKDLNIDKAVSMLNEFISFGSKEFTNYQKRNKRLIYKGMTRRQLNKQNLIARIHKLKNNDNLKQVEVAALVGKSKSTVSKYWKYVHLNGKWTNPLDVEKDKLIEEMWQKLLNDEWEIENLEEIKQWHIEFKKSIEEIINSPLI